MSSSTERSRREDAGVSLAEVLVAVTLTMGLLLVLMSSVISTSRSSRQSDARSGDLAAVREASFAMTRALRAAAGPTIDAASFVSGDADTVVFHSNIGNATSAGAIGAPVRYTYDLVADGRGTFDLVETVREPDPSSVAPNSVPAYTGLGQERRRVVARRVVRDTGSPVFQYRDVDDVLLGTGTGLERTLGSVDLPNVTSVQLRLSVRTDTKPGIEPSVVVNRVRISNAYFRTS